MKAGAGGGSTCELCGGEAASYCDSDSAFLCRLCDARVHSANFLVARHLRRPLCSLCCHPHPLLPSFSGPSPPSPSQPLLTCPSCSSSSSPSSSCCSSSSCVSTADKDAVEIFSADSSRRRRSTGADGAAAAAVLLLVENWCRRVGLEEGGDAGVAAHAVGVGVRELRSLPARVCAAAAVWFAAKVATGGRKGMARVLRKLEACSGVTAKVILAAESRLAGVVRKRHVDAEGSDEC